MDASRTKPTSSTTSFRTTTGFASGSRGFAFVEMGSEQEAQAAIQEMDGVELDGRFGVRRPDRPAALDRRRVVRAGVQGDVAAGDAGQGAQTDRGTSSAVERRQLVVVDGEDLQPVEVGQRPRHAVALAARVGEHDLEQGRLARPHPRTGPLTICFP